MRTNTDGQKNVHTTHEDHAVRRSERRITRESVSFDFVHQYNVYWARTFLGPDGATPTDRGTDSPGLSEAGGFARVGESID